VACVSETLVHFQGAIQCYIQAERSHQGHCYLSGTVHIPSFVNTPWSESASEQYRPSDRRLSAKLVPTFAARGCHVVSVTDLYGCILGFLDRNRYFSSK
jgi:hypothetical protein